MSKELEDLNKAIDEATGIGSEQLKKSQQAFDFTAPDTHHVGYQRHNASGTVSQIAAKGFKPVDHTALNRKRGHQKAASTDRSHASHWEYEGRSGSTSARQKEAAARASSDSHEAAAAAITITPHPVGTKIITAHDLRYPHASKQGTITKVIPDSGIGGGGIPGYHVKLDGGDTEIFGHTDIDHVEDTTAAEPEDTRVFAIGDGDGGFKFHKWDGSPIENYDGEYTWYNGDGQSHQMHTWMDESGERAYSAISKDEWQAKFGDTNKTEDPVAPLVAGIEKAANDLLQHPHMERYKEEVWGMIQNLKDNPSAGHAFAVGNRLQTLAENNNTFREGQDVMASPTYGGAVGRVKSTNGDYVIVEHTDGTEHSYHFSDLDSLELDDEDDE